MRWRCLEWLPAWRGPPGHRATRTQWRSLNETGVAEAHATCQESGTRLNPALQWRGIGSWGQRRGQLLWNLPITESAKDVSNQARSRPQQGCGKKGIKRPPWLLSIKTRDGFRFLSITSHQFIVLFSQPQLWSQ